MAGLQLIITNIGKANIHFAEEDGFKFEAIEFRLGAGTGYTASREQTALVGPIQYTGTPVNFYKSMLPNTDPLIAPSPVDTTNFECILPETVGDFDSGEFGLYVPLPGSPSNEKVLFAIGVFASPLKKRASGPDKTGNLIVIQCSVQTNDQILDVNVNVNTTPHFNLMHEFPRPELLFTPNANNDRVARLTMGSPNAAVLLAGMRSTLVHSAYSDNLPESSQEFIPDNYKLVFMMHNNPRIYNGYNSTTQPAVNRFSVALPHNVSDELYDKLPLPHNELLVSFYQSNINSNLRGKLVRVQSVAQYLNGGQEILTFTLAENLPVAPTAGTGIKLYHPKYLIEEVIAWDFDIITPPSIDGPTSVNISSGNQTPQYTATGSVSFDPSSNGIITYHWTISGYEAAGAIANVTSFEGPVLDLTLEPADFSGGGSLTIQCYATDNMGNTSDTTVYNVTVLEYTVPTITINAPGNVADVNVNHSLTSTINAGGDPTYSIQWWWEDSAAPGVQQTSGFSAPTSQNTSFVHSVIGRTMTIYARITNDAGNATDTEGPFIAVNPATADPDSQYIDTVDYDFSAGGGGVSEGNNVTTIVADSGTTFSLDSPYTRVCGTTDPNLWVVGTMEPEGNPYEGFPTLNLWNSTTDAYANPSQSKSLGTLHYDSSAWDTATCTYIQHGIMPTDTTAVIVAFTQREFTQTGTQGGEPVMGVFNGDLLYGVRYSGTPWALTTVGNESGRSDQDQGIEWNVTNPVVVIPLMGARNGKMVTAEADDQNGTTGSGVFEVQGYLFNSTTMQLTKGVSAPNLNVEFDLFVSTYDTRPRLAIETWGQGKSLLVQWTVSGNDLILTGRQAIVDGSGNVTLGAASNKTVASDANLYWIQRRELYAVRLSDSMCLVLWSQRNDTDNAGYIRGVVITTSGTNVIWNTTVATLLTFTAGSPVQPVIKSVTHAVGKAMLRLSDRLALVGVSSGVPVLDASVSTEEAYMPVVPETNSTHSNNPAFASAMISSSGSIVEFVEYHATPANEVVRYSTTGPVGQITYDHPPSPVEIIQQGGQDPWQQVSAQIQVFGDCSLILRGYASATDVPSPSGSLVIMESLGRASGTRTLSVTKTCDEIGDAAAAYFYWQLEITVYTGTAEVRNVQIDFFT